MRVSPPCLRELPGGAKIVFGNAGDHPLIAALLSQEAMTPRTEDFQSRNDAPSYSPADRLLARREGQLIGHVHLSQLIGWFHGERCPLVKLNDFVVLPEYQRKADHATDHAASLLQLAETTAASEGAMLAVQHTSQPEWFQRHGWSRCRAHGHTQANTRAILSHLDAQQSLRQRRVGKEGPAIEIRSWRHIELDCLRHIYEQSVPRMWGALHRTEEAWQWLVGRKAHDQILLAIARSARTDRSGPWDEPMPPDSDTPENLTANANGEDSEPVPPDGMKNICKLHEAVGYAVLRDSCIIEMFTLPGFSSACIPLIAQVCHDAIDRDHNFVELHTPVLDPMHELLVTAGGSWQRSASAGGEWIFKLLSPNRWLERLYPVLQQRARAGGLKRPLEIAMELDGQACQLTLTRRSVRLQPELAPPCEQYPGRVICDWLAFQDLLTSNLIVSEAIARGRLKTAEPETSQALADLFPFQLFWQSPFELLRL